MATADHDSFHAYISELREKSLDRISLLAGVMGWLLLSWALWPANDERLIRMQARPFVLLLLLVAGVTYFWRRGISLRALLLVSAMLVFSLGIIISYAAPEAIILLVIPIALTNLLFGQKAFIALTAALAGACLFWLPPVIGATFEALLPPTTLVLGVVIIIAVLMNNLYTALAWTVNSFELTLRNQALARDRQAELAQALKSLDIATQNLQRTNHALQIAQKQAEQARQLKQQFAQTISHELRTPLNLIIGFTETMVKSPEYYGAPLPPRYMRDLSIVYRNANHLQDLVNDVLDMARIEASQTPLQLVMVPLCEFIDEVLELAASMVESHKLTFDSEIGDDLPASIWMDSIRVKQVIINLLSNAVRFTEEGGIRLRVQAAGDVVLFSVIDTGIGIAEDDIARIFEPFQQLENPMRRRVGGVGLGLPISRQLVALHGGVLNVRSRPGMGSTFTFSLPVGAPYERPHHGDDTLTFPEQPDENIVLLVTNSPAAASLISRHLAGFRTVVVNSLEQARLAMAQIVPQAIILDKSEPELQSVDLVAFAAASQLAAVTVISCPLPGEARLRQQLMANSYLIKPVSRASLWDTIRLFGESVDHILIVDDDRDFVQLLTRMLDNALKRYRISAAYNGQEAIAVLQRVQPDLILLDLEMPVMNGFQLLERLRQHPRWRALPVVIVSAEEELESYNDTPSTLEVAKVPQFSQNDLVTWLRALLH